jgi:cytochrome d ubiquinol oxidase subunit I
MRNPVVRLCFSMAMWMAAIVTPIQILAGDTQGRNTLQYQPAKLAAIEGDFDSGVQPLHLIGFPNEKTGKVDYDIAIPHLGSVILDHEWNGAIKGLDAFPRNDWPVVDVTFYAFRIMVGLGMLMFLVGMLSLWLRKRGKLYDATWFHRFAVVMGPAGFLAIVAGWTTTETGRQPWTVEGLLRTADSMSPLTLHEVAASFIVILVVYTVVFGSGIRYLLGMMATAPVPGEPPPLDDAPLRSHGRHGLMSKTHLAPGE